MRADVGRTIIPMWQQDHECLGKEPDFIISQQIEIRRIDGESGHGHHDFGEPGRLHNVDRG